MEQSSVVTQGWSLSAKWGLGLGVIALVSLAILVYYCCCSKKKDHAEKKLRRSSSNSIESFQQLYFTNTPSNPIKNIDRRVIERWSSVDQPSMTFYRVYIQDNPDGLYQPVTEERLHASINQSKAMEYAAHEIIFF